MSTAARVGPTVARMLRPGESMQTRGRGDEAARIGDSQTANDASPSTREPGARPHVVVAGAGFGGLSVAKGLKKCHADVTLIDRRNYHLFQPLLYQVATAGLSPADVAAPIRGIVNDQANTRVILGQVTDVDAARREVLLGGKRIPYDYLVLATGARHAYTHDDWELYAPGLKKIEDATQMRAKILMAFEEAEMAEDDEERQGLLTFLVVGGGPTGVELAGAIAELAKRALARDFRNIDPRAARILLLQKADRLLPSFPASLSAIAQRSLERLGVEVQTGVSVDHVDADGAIVSGHHVAARTVICAAGVIASPAGRWLDAEHDRAGRVRVLSDLSVPSHPNIFVIGDTACALGANDRPLPGTAPVAKQQGDYIAGLLRARIAGKRFDAPFRYRHFGNMATIGRSHAVADFGFVRLSGYLAWVLWGVAHVFYLIGFRSKIMVTMTWMWQYLTFQRGMRLITGPSR